MSSIHLATKEARIFWGEIAPAPHFAQFYEDDHVLLDTLTGFIGGGLMKGEATIVIATGNHLRALTQRLADTAVDLATVIRRDRFVTLDAEVALTSFMTGDLPDGRLFSSFVESLLRRASVNGSYVRAFDEMGALLWAKGLSEATIQLENLWQQLCKRRSLSLFCAYPKAAFTKDSTESLAEICAAHSKII